MLNEQELEVRQGIWIDKEWLKNAGLSGRLHVVVQPGEIRILPGPAAVEGVSTPLGWNIFQTIGDEATPGQLPDAATEHDRYLYGKLNVEAAIQLNREGQVTLGRAAEIAGITRWEAETLLADRGIVRFMSSDPADELERQWDSLV